MENAEEVLQCLDEFSKMKPKDIPRELEDYLCFVAKTGDPVYQWPIIKCLFREKLLNVITEFYESCPTVEIPPCPNVEAFNYDSMKNFILEKLDTFAAAPFTVQRICELLTTPRKEYNRIDKYMRALEKNILVVSTREPGSRKSTENGENVVNGLESEHGTQDVVNSDVNVEVEMDETTTWQKTEPVPYTVSESSIILESQPTHPAESETYVSESKVDDNATCSSSGESVITSRSINYIGYTPNITDLIIETSAVSSNPEPGATTPMTVERDANITVFAMSNEYPENVKEAADSAEPTYASGEPSLVEMESSTNTEPKVESEASLREAETVQEAEPVQVAEPAVEIPEIQPIQPVQSEPEPSVQPEPESSTTAHIEPESTVYVNTESVQQASLVEDETNDSTISSTEQLPVNSTDVQPATEPEVPETRGETSEDQVTESNIESEYVVSQTEEAVTPSEAVSTVLAEPAESHQEEADERMQVDEVTTEPLEPKIETQDAQTTQDN